MTTISFIGDIMLGRFVAEQYKSKPYQLVAEDVVSELMKSDVRIANLESPIFSVESEDSLKFAAAPELLDQFKWMDCFSLSNNHINDFSTNGMIETIEALDNHGIIHNGLYTEKYKPYLIDKDGDKIAVIMCADMMNYEFVENCPYKTLRVNRPEEIISCIKEYKSMGFFVILYAHVGMLFTRFPNPVIRDFVHQMVDEGADCIVTAHPHCLGGYEYYNDKLIVYSLGDFLMDGASFRRRRAGILNIHMVNGKIDDWSIVPVETSMDLSVDFPSKKIEKRMLKSFDHVSCQIAKHSDSYMSFYKMQYKKELLAHSWSTVRFEFKRRGLIGLFKTLFKRIGAVKGMARRVVTDRSTMSYDADAVGKNNISIKDIR